MGSQCNLKNWGKTCRKHDMTKELSPRGPSGVKQFKNGVKSVPGRTEYKKAQRWRPPRSDWNNYEKSNVNQAPGARR